MNDITHINLNNHAKKIDDWGLFLSGYSYGANVREELGLKDIESPVVLELTTESFELAVVSTTFMLGLLGPVVRNLGKYEFLQQYELDFDNSHPHINLKRIARIALRDNTPLSSLARYRKF